MEVDDWFVGSLAIRDFGGGKEMLFLCDRVEYNWEKGMTFGVG